MSDEAAFRGATPEEIEAVARDLGLSLTSTEREKYQTLVNGVIEGIDGIREPLPFDAELEPADLDGRSRSYRPDRDDDPLNAWITKFTVTGNASGPLDGVTWGSKTRSPWQDTR